MCPNNRVRGLDLGLVVLSGLEKLPRFALLEDETRKVKPLDHQEV